MEISIQTDQILILEQFFSSLSTLDQRKIFTSAYRKAAKPLITLAKATAPSSGRKGNLRASIGSAMIPQEIAIVVGARKGKYKGWHAHFTESGTTERFRKSGASTGRVTGTHWFEQAYDATQEGMYNTIENEWLKEIDKFIIRVNKRKT